VNISTVLLLNFRAVYTLDRSLGYHAPLNPARNKQFGDLDPSRTSSVSEIVSYEIVCDLRPRNALAVGNLT
jgi:hypothetical protein